MRIFLFTWLVFFVEFSYSYNCFPQNNSQKKIINKIVSNIYDGKLYKAEVLLRSQEDLPVFLALKAEIAWMRDDFIAAERLCLSVIDLCPDNFPKVYYFLGEMYFDVLDYLNAKKYLERSINLSLDGDFHKEALNMLQKSKIISSIINNPLPYNPRVVGGVSTEFDEYLPYMSADQEIFFFTRRSFRSGLDVLVPGYVEEFTMSIKSDKEFSLGTLMRYPFNQESNEGGASMTIDNRILYFTKCTRNSSGYNNCDIYYVEKLDSGWSNVNNFSSEISNESTWESQPSVSSDGKTIIFASDRSGGYGNIDLYEINYIDGKWTAPVNLGSKINSINHEKSPFLHADGQTLFFSSTRFPSIGGFDIFYSRKDSFGDWQDPINIGYPINSSNDEISLFVSTDGLKAYFASNNIDTVGGWDIYSFDLHKSAKPNRVLFLKGNLLYENDMYINDIELNIRNINTQEIKTVKVTGGSYAYSLTLENSDDVLITVKENGFAFSSFYISAEDTSFNSPASLDIVLVDLEEGDVFPLENVHFESNSSLLNNISRQVILEFSDYLILNKSLIVEINGFTDNVGEDSYNQSLSERRAFAVYNLVVSQGVDVNRITFNGYGEKFPVSDNNSVSGRAMNRRTEIRSIER